jgi:glutamate dehydrogenase/leucine dehydrogenase
VSTRVVDRLRHRDFGTLGPERGEVSDARAMWRRYAAFVRTPPLMNVAWQDPETGARAWLVINSDRGGAAGGGTRMRPGMGAREVIYLAKAMELKFAISGPAIAGAKSGIDFDPADPRKARVLERWYRAIEPLLRDRYGTGGDLNVDEVLEVLPTFQRLGLFHPQEGVVRGHVRPDAAGLHAIMQRMEQGIEAPVDGTLGVSAAPQTVADLITGFGVAAAIRRFYTRMDRPLDGVRVKLEGFGNVGAACGLYLARAGARIVAISDARHTLLDPLGLDAQSLETLFTSRRGKMLPADDPRVYTGPDREAFWNAPADVFVCAAISESLTTPMLERLAATGVGVIACGANQPFREVKVGSTRVAQFADRRFSVLPDILSNCGMARTFSYLMQSDASPSADPIFMATQRTIEDALDEVMDRAGNRTTTLLAATLGMAMDRIGAE